MSADKWRKKAEDLETQVDQLVADGRVDQAYPLALQAAGYRQLVDQLEQGLPVQTKHGKKRGMDSIALRMADGRKTKSRLSQAALAAGYTLRSLAEAAGTSHAQLSSAHAGRWTIQESIALKVQELLGNDDKGKPLFPATKKNWPKGWAR